MPVEMIGECGTPGASRSWISAQGTLAIRHVISTCGPPPPENGTAGSVAGTRTWRLPVGNFPRVGQLE
jgi:hypothetical protein